jgi:hypothetical protein
MRFYFSQCIEVGVRVVGFGYFNSLGSHQRMFEK